MGIKATRGIVLTLLAIVVAIALTWAFIALPYWVSGVLYSSYQSDDVRDLGHGPQDEESQPYIHTLHIRTIGYASLIIVIGLYTMILFGLSYVYEMFDHLVVPFWRLDLFPYAYEILADRL
jgi:hypothetical protein